MAEYISKEQVIEWFRPYRHTEEGIPFDVLETDIAGIPAADVVPVRLGRWVHDGCRINGGIDWCHCSECGWNDNFATRTNYCPNCGAIMDAWRCSLRGIDKNPTVNVEPVVRCKKCKYGTPVRSGSVICGHPEYELLEGALTYGEDHFCAYGERKDGC